MRRTSVLACLGVVAVIVLAAEPALSAYGAIPAKSTVQLAGFRAIKGGPVSVTTAHLPSASTKPTTVILQLAAKPVTVADADAAQPFSKSQRAALRATLVRTQAPIASAVKARGGKVIASYQLVYNGLKVTAPANKIAALQRIPGVAAVRTLTPKTFDNIHGVPLIGAPQIWQGVGAAGSLTGEGMKIGIIDTGIDYTHADFGGPGTTDAYQAALSTDTQPADPSMFGPDAPRVKGGIDLVGDAYTGNNTPQPDPNPLDCNSHGTHVAGTAAGSGVLSDGTTFTGPYGADTVSGHDWLVGPGVAPRASLYAIRVFGCSGSTREVIDGLEWAVANGMDVVNMSLGSPYGGANDPDAVAANNAAGDGVIVAVSAGNNGTNPYLVGSPGSATSAITVAASDPTSGYPGASVALSTAPSNPLTMIDANGASLAGLDGLPVKVLYTGTTHDAAHISLGCDPSEYTNADVAGDIVVVLRGTCGRVDRAIYGQQAGAAAVVMINSSAGYPPFEGPITKNADTNAPYDVTIPFLGALSSDTNALVAADNAVGTADLSDAFISNPGYLVPASFDSGGARSGDSVLKPDVTAPGVSIISAGMGTGTGSLVDSGTSMAAPHTAGLAALVREAHHNWGKVKYWKAAIVNTASADLVNGYTARVAGAGLIQGPPAVATDTVALGDSNTATLSYQFAELHADYAKTHKITLRNFGPAPATFDIADAHDGGSPHSLVVPDTITVPAHGTATVPVKLVVPAATAGGSSSFHDVSGLVTLTPDTDADNNNVTLSVPYYLVPQAVSHVTTTVPVAQLVRHGTASATIANPGGIVSGNADWFSWGLSDGRDAGTGPADLHAVGVQTYGAGAIAFAVNTYHRWSNAASTEYDIQIDVNDDNTPDYDVFEYDLGVLEGQPATGQAVVAVYNYLTHTTSATYYADAPTNSTTMVLPVTLAQLCQGGSPCLTSASPEVIRYSAAAYGAGGTYDSTSNTASYNVASPSVSTGMNDTVAPNTATTQTVSLNSAEFAVTPSRGFMIVTHDNPNATEARLIKLPAPPTP